MIYCETCTRFKKVIAIEKEKIILLCGHIVQPKGNKAYCSKCETLIPITRFNGLQPILNCGHTRTDHDDDMDKVINNIRKDIDKNPEKIKEIISKLSDLVKDDIEKEAKKLGITPEEYKEEMFNQISNQSQKRKN